MKNLEQQGQLFIYANDPVRGWSVSPVDTVSTLIRDANTAIDRQFSQDLPFRQIPLPASLVLHNRLGNDWIVAFKPPDRMEWRGILIRDDAYALFERNPYAMLDHFATSLALSDRAWPTGWGSAPLFPKDQQPAVRAGSDYLVAARKAYEAAAASAPSTYYSALPLDVPPGRSPLSVFRLSTDDDDWGSVDAVDSSVHSGAGGCSSDECGESIEVSTTANTQIIKEFHQKIDALIQTRREVSAQLEQTTKELRHITLDLDHQRRQFTEWHQNQLASDREPNSVNANKHKDFSSLHEEIAALREQLNQVSQTVEPRPTDHRWKSGLIIVFFILSAAGFAAAAYYTVTLNDQLVDVKSMIGTPALEAAVQRQAADLLNGLNNISSKLDGLNSELNRVGYIVAPTDAPALPQSISELTKQIDKIELSIGASSSSPPATIHAQTTALFQTLQGIQSLLGQPETPELSIFSQIEKLNSELNQVGAVVAPTNKANLYQMVSGADSRLARIESAIGKPPMREATIFAQISALHQELGKLNSAITGLKSELSKASKAVPPTGDDLTLSKLVSNIASLLNELKQSIEVLATKLDSLNRSQLASPPIGQQRSR